MANGRTRARRFQFLMLQEGIQTGRDPASRFLDGTTLLTVASAEAGSRPVPASGGPVHIAHPSRSVQEFWRPCSHIVPRTKKARRLTGWSKERRS